MIKYYSVLGDTSIDKMNPVSIIKRTHEDGAVKNEYRHKSIKWTENDDYVARHLFVITPDGTSGDLVPITESEVNEIIANWTA